MIDPLPLDVKGFISITSENTHRFTVKNNTLKNFADKKIVKNQI